MDLDMSKCTNDIVMNAFVTPCEHRKAYGTSKLPVCELLVDMTATAAYVDAGTCANCRLYGPVDDEYLKPIAKKTCEQNFHKVSRGFHGGPNQIPSVIEYAFQSSFGDAPMRARIEKTLVLCVGVARITADAAHAVLEKHAYPVKHALHAEIDAAHADLVARLTKGIVPAQAVDAVADKTASPLSWIRSIAKAASSVAVAVAGPQATPEVQAKRKETCEGCAAVDSLGKPLFRGDGQPTCGALGVNPNRNVKVDGCGCYLRVKWKGRDEQCPLGKW